jgi:hypothetical protein
MTFDEKILAIKEDIEKFNPEVLLINAIQKNHSLSKLSPEQYNGFTPWEMLLFIKWVFVFGKHDAHEIPTGIELNSVVNKIKDLSGVRNKFLIEKSQHGVSKFIRQLAFQQFWLQKQISMSTLGRQIEIFRHIKSKYDYNDKFLALTGLTLKEFFEIAVICWTGFCLDSSSFVLDRSWFSKMDPKYPNGQIDIFLKLITLDYHEAKIFAENSFKSRSIDMQLVEQSPFKRYPLLVAKTKYFTYSPALLSACFESYIYDLLKKNFGSSFCESFGQSFEIYLEKPLLYFKTPYLNEAYLKRKLDRKNVIDFVVPSSRGTILIESKAIELNPRAQMNPETGVMEETLQSSIIKAVYQANKVGEQFIIERNTWKEIPSTKNFLLIVTYKDLYLGTGADAWGEFISSGLAKSFSFPIESELFVDPNNIFFLSVHEYEHFIRVSKGCPERMVEILEGAIDNNLSSLTSKYMFSMHLESFEINPDDYANFPFSEDHVENIFDEVISKLKD